MGWFHRWQTRRAAKRYARRLGPHLARAYGPSKHYSASQIRTAIGKLGLNPKYLALGYAGFLPEEAYAALAADVPVHLPYRHARDLFERFRPPHLFQAPHYYESGIGLLGGSEASGHADGGSH